MPLSLFTLFGPGQKLIHGGMKSLLRGAPNMNTLVGLGALSLFTVSTSVAFIPKLIIGYMFCLLEQFYCRILFFNSEL